ncbi:thioesterase superfamily protein-like protein [Hymenopellis radicata]|nr:thioesterase superfamily protein-like protein [Hymenopellis radicata]
MPPSDLKSRTRADYAYHLPYRTRWSDNDQYGHMNNSIYYHFFDSIINDYLIKHCGLTGNPQTTPVIGLVVSSFCEFFAPLSFPQMISLGLRVTKVGRSSVSYEVGVFPDDAQQPAAVGGYTHVFVDSESRKSVTIRLHQQLETGLKALVQPSIAKL